MRKKARRSTGCTTVRHRGKSETSRQKVWGKCEGEGQNRGGLDMAKDVSRRTLSAKVFFWRKSHLSVKRWESEEPRELEQCQSRNSETMSPPMAPCQEYQAGGVRVVGQWCSLIMMRR